MNQSSDGATVVPPDLKPIVDQCKDGNGMSKDHYWHWKWGTERWTEYRECGTCGKIERNVNHGVQ